jgi:large subunit ribosomal protein L9
MANRLEVLLVQDVLKLGNMGDVVKVAAGHARNYLFPYDLAIPVSMAHKRQIEVLREKASKMEVEREGKAAELKKKLDGLRLRIGARVVSETELFGSIGARDIANEIAKLGFKVDSKQVHLHDRIKKLGTYEVEVRLHKKVGSEIVVEVFNSDPNATIAEAISEPKKKADAPAAPAAAMPKAPKTKVKNLGKAHEPAQSE